MFASASNPAAEFLVQRRGDQFVEAQSVMTLENGSDHVDALEAGVSTRFASSRMRGYEFSLVAAGLSHPPKLLLEARCL